MTNQNPSTAALLSTSAAAHHLVDAELSAASRFGYVTLLLVSLAMSVVTGALWLTEPALPARASGRARGVDGDRRVLGGVRDLGADAAPRPLRRHSVVAGRMAVTFTSIFAAGAIAVGLTTAARAIRGGWMRTGDAGGGRRRPPAGAPRIRPACGAPAGARSGARREERR